MTPSYVPSSAPSIKASFIRHSAIPTISIRDNTSTKVLAGSIIGGTLLLSLIIPAYLKLRKTQGKPDMLDEDGYDADSDTPLPERPPREIHIQPALSSFLNEDGLFDLSGQNRHLSDHGTQFLKIDNKTS